MGLFKWLIEPFAEIHEEAIDNIVDLNLDKSMLSKLILHSCKKLHTGSFSLTFRDALINILKEQRYDTITDLLKLTKEEIYPELFNNPKQ